MPPAADTRPSTAGRFALSLGGSSVSSLKKFSGMAMAADVSVSDAGPVSAQKKQVTNIKWTAGKATVGMGMGRALYDWIKQSFATGSVPKNGRLVSGDVNFKAQSALDFEDALITEVVVPNLDASSKDAAYFDITFQPGRVRWSKGQGEDVRPEPGPKQKAWLCSNFRIEIGSLPCARVASVDSFAWTCAIGADRTGISRDPANRAGRVTVPDLTLKISMADLPLWAEAAKKWFVDGQHLDTDEMDGRIVFLGPDLKEKLGEITLKHVGFKKFSTDEGEESSPKTALFTVELYVENMTFNITEYDA
jgi:hypothetical protein